MRIHFKKNNHIDEITITVENNYKDKEVKEILVYLSNYDQYANTLTIEKEGQIYKLQYSDIYWIEVMGDYISIYSNLIDLCVRKTLQAMELELPSKYFVRVSRNTIVNIQKIIKIENSFSGTMSATLTQGQKIHISRKYWKNIKQRILNND